MKITRFDPEDIPPVPVSKNRTSANSAMRAARERVARRAAAQAAIDRGRREARLDYTFEQRLADARQAIAPKTAVAYLFDPREGKFRITALSEEDIAPLGMDKQ